MSLTDQYKQLHEDKNLFAGTTIGLHKQSIRQGLELSQSKTILDYGCGKGIQYFKNNFGTIVYTLYCNGSAVARADFQVILAGDNLQVKWYPANNLLGTDCVLELRTDAGFIFTHDGKKSFCQCDICSFALSAQVINLADSSLAPNGMYSCTMVFYMNPIPDIQTISINGNGFISG